MRLIDAEKVYEVLTEYYHHRTEIQHEALKEAIERVPTVDAVEVVRCKDCKFGQRLIDANGLHYLFCGNPFGHGIMVGNHSFCSWGEMDVAEKHLTMPKADGSTIPKDYMMR